MRSLLLLAGAALAAASTIVINAGQSGLSFSPDSTTAKVGDVLEFHFFGAIHSVVQGSFSSPCQSNGGFDSGTVKNTASGDGSVFQVTVTNTDPIWFFCGSPTHCQGGMAGVVNPPSGETIADYQSAAGQTSSSSPASGPVGGVLVPFPFSSTSSAPAKSASTSSASKPPPSSSASVPPPSSSSVSKPPPSSSSVSKPPPSSSSVSKPPPSSSSGSKPPSSSSGSPPKTSASASSTSSPSKGTTSVLASASSGSNATIAGVPPATSGPVHVTTSGATSGLALLAVIRSSVVGALVALAAGALGLLL